MGWLNLPANTVIAIDSAPLIYFIEKAEPYASLLLPLFELIARDEVTAVTSTITLVEVFCKPFQEKRHEIIAAFEKSLLSGNNFNIFPVTENIALQAARLRAQYGLRTPDAVQIATAQEAQANYFLTNDLKLKNISGIKCLVVKELLDF